MKRRHRSVLLNFGFRLEAQARGVTFPDTPLFPRRTGRGPRPLGALPNFALSSFNRSIPDSLSIRRRHRIITDRDVSMIRPESSSTSTSTNKTLDHSAESHSSRAMEPNVFAANTIHIHSTQSRIPSGFHQLPVRRLYAKILRSFY